MDHNLARGIRHGAFCASYALLSAAAITLTSPANAQECADRGTLDAMFCDADGDLVADAPTDPAKLVNPDTLVFAYTPVEDPAIYEDIWEPFIAHLEKVTGKDVQFFAVQSNSAEVEAMRSGRLHIAGFSTGPTPFAVDLAGAVPFALMGSGDGRFGYTLQVYTRKDSGIEEMADLKGKRVAHTSPTSNSGNLAPRAAAPLSAFLKAPEKPPNTRRVRIPDPQIAPDHRLLTYAVRSNDGFFGQPAKVTLAVTKIAKDGMGVSAELAGSDRRRDHVAIDLEAQGREVNLAGLPIPLDGLSKGAGARVVFSQRLID